jgi:hypothetical protein
MSADAARQPYQHSQIELVEPDRMSTPAPN